MDRTFFLRGTSAALIAIGAPVALAKPAEASGGACGFDAVGNPAMLAGQCCAAPFQWCYPPIGAPQYGKYWWDHPEPCPKD